MIARLRELTEGYVAQTLEAAELTELENLLGESEQARLDFLSYIEVHAGLAWELRGSVSESAPPAGGKIIRAFPKTRIIAMAAAITLLAALSFLFMSPRKTGGSIARVTASLHGQWLDGREITTGTGLGAGTWELQSGLVELQTAQGTTLLLEGPATLELTGPLHARLIAGNLVVRMPKGSSGFVVDMPRMKVTDLGTEFGVSVASDGQSSVQVYDGKVRAESDASSAELVAGETKLSGSDGTMASVPFKEERFIRTFPPVRLGSQPGGPLYNRSSIAMVDAAAAKGPVTIDGSLSEWDRSVAFRTACEPPYASTYFVEGMMMYDAANLYLAAHVGDPAPMSNSSRPGMEFAGGSVIVRVATDRKLGWPLRGSQIDSRTASPSPDSLSDRIASIIMWHDAKSSQPRLLMLRGFDFHGKDEVLEGWRGTFRKDADGKGYTLEYAIPWSLLHSADDPPMAGDQLAALWMAHWSDEEGRICRGQLVDVVNPAVAGKRDSLPHIFYQDGSSWGKVRYLPSVK